MKIRWLNNGLYSLKNCHKQFGQAFRPPPLPPFGQCPNLHGFSWGGASLSLLCSQHSWKCGFSSGNLSIFPNFQELFLLILLSLKFHFWFLGFHFFQLWLSGVPYLLLDLLQATSYYEGFKAPLSLLLHLFHLSHSSFHHPFLPFLPILYQPRLSIHSSKVSWMLGAFLLSTLFDLDVTPFSFSFFRFTSFLIRDILLPRPLKDDTRLNLSTSSFG